MQQPALTTAPAVESPITDRLNRAYGLTHTAPRPIVTFRVVLRETGAALRRTADIDRPTLGDPRDWNDVAEFASEEQGEIARRFVYYGLTGLRSDQVEVKAILHPGLERAQENALLCAVRDTACWLAFVDMRDCLTDARRGVVGVQKRPVS